MYSYQLIKNHYIVGIEGGLYIVDAGAPSSYIRAREITINGKRFYTASLNESQLAPIRELVGADVDGFIGADILTQTSLTIYKNGKMEFAPSEVEGNIVPFVKGQPWPLGVSCTLAGEKKAVALIDTGAMIYYGKYPAYFTAKDFVGEWEDYNPNLGKMKTKFYNQTLKIAGKTITAPVGNSAAVARYALGYYQAAVILNVTELFDETVVFDYGRRCLIVK